MFLLTPMDWPQDIPDGALPAQGVPKARGAGLNMAGRFERHRRAALDDGWDRPEDPDPARTEIRTERARSVIARNTSPDIPFDRSLNPYRGCEHGCIYCYARPGHAHLGLSPGLEFETRLIARPDAARVLAAELRKPRYRPAPLCLGSATDPYQPAEARLRITRAVLETLADFGHPVSVQTRGTLIERDLDILGPMAALGLAQVGVSLTTLDAGLSRRLEPRAPAPARRLATITALANAGVPVRVMVSPVIPGLTDAEVEPILQAATDTGARAASWALLRLPHEVAPLFLDWLDRHAPGRRDKVLNRLRDAHRGALYRAEFGHRTRGSGVMADLLAQRFRAATRRLGLDGGLPPLDCTRFAPPPRPGDQLSLF